MDASLRSAGQNKKASRPQDAFTINYSLSIIHYFTSIIFLVCTKLPACNR